MSIGIGNLLNMFLRNGETNMVKGGVLHVSRPPRAVQVESEADLFFLGELPAGSIAYTAGYAQMWQLSAAGSWEAIEEEGGSGSGGALVVTAEEGTTSDGGDAYYIPMTYNEIKAAMDAGQIIIVKFPAWEDWGKLGSTGVVTECKMYLRDDQTYGSVSVGVANSIEITSFDSGYIWFYADV